MSEDLYVCMYVCMYSYSKPKKVDLSNQCFFIVTSHDLPSPTGRAAPQHLPPLVEVIEVSSDGVALLQSCEACRPFASVISSGPGPYSYAMAGP